jgi:hypothetical protein
MGRKFRCLLMACFKTISTVNYSYGVFGTRNVLDLLMFVIFYSSGWIVSFAK